MVFQAKIQAKHFLLNRAPVHPLVFLAVVERHFFQQTEGVAAAFPPLAQQEANSEFGVEMGGAPRPPLGAQVEPPGEEPACSRILKPDFDQFGIKSAENPVEFDDIAIQQIRNTRLRNPSIPALLVQPQLVYGVDVEAAPALNLQEDHVAQDPEVVDPLDPGTQFNGKKLA